MKPRPYGRGFKRKSSIFGLNGAKSKLLSHRAASPKTLSPSTDKNASVARRFLRRLFR
jgi:hypothetical protein